MPETTLYIGLALLVILSSWLFGALLVSLGKRRNWRTERTFWISAISYAVLGFVFPILLLEISYSDFLIYWITAFGFAAVLWMVILVVLKRTEGRTAQSGQPIVQTDRSLAFLPPAAQKKKIKQPIPSSLSTTAARIFVSYRRSDSADIAGRIYDRLTGRFGRDAIFKDVDSIPLGLDFKEYLEKQVGQCDVMLAIIGDGWLNASDSHGDKRLEDPADFVRIEIQSALEREIPVIPLLVRGAPMPGEESLPASLRKLVFRNGIPIRSDPDFHRDMDRLIAGLEKYVK